MTRTALVGVLLVPLLFLGCAQPPPPRNDIELRAYEADARVREAQIRAVADVSQEAIRGTGKVLVEHERSKAERYRARGHSGSPSNPNSPATRGPVRGPLPVRGRPLRGRVETPQGHPPVRGRPQRGPVNGYQARGSVDSGRARGRAPSPYPTRGRCNRCQNTGHFLCGKCDGHGALNCWYCGGSGKGLVLNCVTCERTGRLRCKRCDGYGVLVCDHRP